MREQLYSIGETSKMTGVSRRQLRNWETKGYIPAPQRVVCRLKAYRFYNEDDIALLKRIQSCLNNGLTLKSAAEMAKKFN